MNHGLTQESLFPRRAEFFRYSLLLTDGRLRKGVLIRLEDADGAVGWGDAAPLDGWSRESFADVEQSLQNETPWHERPSSVQCAWEAACVSLAEFSETAEPIGALPLNALLVGTFADVLRASQRALERGCHCLKIKTSALVLEELPELLREISRFAANGCRFRLDPNRAWNFDSTLRVAESLRGLPVDYLEEPLCDSSRLPELIKYCPVGIALDETLREVVPQQLAEYEGAVALVLKPTLLGGFRTSAEFARVGLDLGMTPVISACYESGVGIRALGRFALSLPKTAPAGLDTYSRLAEDVLCERLDLGAFIFHGEQPLPDVDFSKLHPL
ncbi:MAG: enolase C-terminal domain-like protein [bacterium]